MLVDEAMLIFPPQVGNRCRNLFIKGWIVAENGWAEPRDEKQSTWFIEVEFLLWESIWELACVEWTWLLAGLFWFDWVWLFADFLFWFDWVWLWDDKWRLGLEFLMCWIYLIY